MKISVASAPKLSKNPHTVGVSPSNPSSVQGDLRSMLAHAQAHSGTSGVGGSGGPGNPTLNQATAASLQTMSPKAMNTMHHFTEFVKAFCDFGSEMVHLVRLTTSKNLKNNSYDLSIVYYNISDFWIYFKDKHKKTIS